MINKDKSETELDDALDALDEPHTANTLSTASISASATPGPLPTLSSLLPPATSTTHTLIQSQSHAPPSPFIESATQQQPTSLGNASILQPQLGGLLTFLDNDNEVNMFASASLAQPGYAPNSPLDDPLEFPLSLPFQTIPSAAPTNPALHVLDSFTTTVAQTATATVEPTLAIPASTTPSSVADSVILAPSSEIPPSETLTSVVLSSGALSLNGVTTTSMVPTPMTTCAVLTNPESHKENTAPEGISTPVGNDKKRKAQIDAKGKRFKVTEDSSMTVGTCAQEKDAEEIRESSANGIAATRSGRKSNLPSRFKDAAPAKRGRAKE